MLRWRFVVLAMYRRKYRLWFWGAFFFAGMLLWRIRYILAVIAMPYC